MFLPCWEAVTALMSYIHISCCVETTEAWVCSAGPRSPRSLLWGRGFSLARMTSSVHMIPEDTNQWLCLKCSLKCVSFQSQNLVCQLFNMFFFLTKGEEFNLIFFSSLTVDTEQEIYSWRNLQSHIAAIWRICLFSSILRLLLIWLRKWG